MKIYKCYYDDGYCLKFSDDGERFYSWSDGSSTSYDEYDFSKVEPLETGDTLQEVVKWSWDEECAIKIELNDVSFYYRNGDKIGMPVNMVLDHIRKPKLKQITQEELAEMGYKLK